MSNMPSRILRSRLLLLLSDGGSDEVELREYDMDKREFVASGFRTSAGRLNAAWLDENHILLSHALYGGPKSVAGWPAETFVWKRGTGLPEVKLAHSILPSDALSMVFSIHGGGDDRQGLIMRAIDFETTVFYLVSVDGTAREGVLPAKPKMSIIPSITVDHLVLATVEEAVVCGKKVPPSTYIVYNFSLNVPDSDRVSIVCVSRRG